MSPYKKFNAVEKGQGLNLWSNRIKEMEENHCGVEPMMEIIIIRLAHQKNGRP